MADQRTIPRGFGLIFTVAALLGLGFRRFQDCEAVGTHMQISELQTLVRAVSIVFYAPVLKTMFLGAV